MNNRRRIEIRRNRRKKEWRHRRSELIAFIKVKVDQDMDAFFNQENTEIAAALGCRHAVVDTGKVEQPPVMKRVRFTQTLDPNDKIVMEQGDGLTWTEVHAPASIGDVSKLIAPDDYITVLGRCHACGHAVAAFLCNEQLQSVRMEAAAWDYWASCVNPTCRNHHGEGYFQALPDWIER